MKTFLIVITLIILIPNVASAKRVGGIFGKSERIEEIAEVNLKGAKGEDLYLAYKTTSLFFFMGVYISDDGYVLGIRKSYGSYYPLSEEKIKELQASGHLPNPLPTYKIPLSERLWGFSLWIMLVVVTGLWILFLPEKKDRYFTNGCKYYFGEKVTVDYHKALGYFTKSAKLGHAGARHNLGIMHLSGRGTAKNTEKAISYFEEAAGQNYTNAQFTLGKLYFEGKAISKDIKKSLSFFNKACTNGDEQGCKMASYIEENKLSDL